MSGTAAVDIDSTLSVDLAALYRDLHAHPELAFAEFRTAGIAAARVRDLGFEVFDGIGGTGVAAVLRNGSGPTVMLRADMDALPVAEATGLAYASTRRGIDGNGVEVPITHACGHDMHVTWLIGALTVLTRERDTWSGTLIAVFQPAEEAGGGAQAMIDDGLFDRVGRPDVVLGQHVVPLSAGTVGAAAGPAMAASDSLRVRFYGRGGHGSRPEAAVDPVVMAAATVLRLQSIVSREVSPFDAAVVTVGSIHAGTKANIIPAEAQLEISVRSFDMATRDRLLAAIGRIVEAEAAASAAPRPPEVEITSSYPVLINDERATARVLAAIGAELGQERIVAMTPVAGSEDFSAFGYAAGVPSCFWFVGGVDPDTYARAEAAGRLDIDIPANHSPLFAPVIEPTLSLGIRAMAAAAREWLGSHPIS